MHANSCYGKSKIAMSQNINWICDYCDYISKNNNNEKPQCIFCPRIGGALKLITLQDGKIKTPIWAHIGYIFIY